MRLYRYRKRYIIYVSLFILLISSSVTNSSVKQKIHLSDKITLCVPISNLMENRLLGWFYGIAGLDVDTDGFTFVFSSQEAAKKIKNYRERYEGVDFELSGIVSVLGPNWKPMNGKNNDFENMWYGRGVYKDSAVEFDAESNLYIIYPQGVMEIWDIFTIKPDVNKLPPDDKDEYWLASCYNVHTNAASKKFPSCTMGFHYKGMAVRSSVTGQNLSVLRDIKSFLLNQLELWRHCD